MKVFLNITHLKKLLPFILCMHTSYTKAQYPNLVFNQLTIGEGLPENNIQCLVQDKLGYIWMGTQAGIVRYDGYKTNVYNFGKEKSLDAVTLTIFEDRSGKIWAGAFFTGLLFYDRATDNFKPFVAAKGNKISNNGILQILDDDAKHLWVISVNYENKIYSLDKINLETGKIARYSSLEKGSQHINATIFSEIIIAKNGKIWLGTNNGFYEYDPVKDSFTGHLTSNDPTGQRRYFSIVEDPLKPGILWMLQSTDTKSAIIEEYQYYSNEGVLQYNSNNNYATHFRFSENSSSICSDTVYAINKDQQNRLWFATISGLSLFDPLQNSFANYKLASWNYTVPGHVVMQPDNKGNVWYAGRNGLQYFDTHTKSFTKYNRDKIPPRFNWNGNIRKILIDRNNTVWVGTYHGGLYWINEKASRFTLIKKDITRPSGYPGGGTFRFAKGKDNTLWIVNESGFYHWFPKSDSFVPLLLDPSNKKIFGRTILFDNKGRLWCGTNNNGIYLFERDNKKTIHYVFNSKDSNSISNNNVYYIYEDSKGRIWIGTWGGGLCLYRPETNDFKRYPYVKNLIKPDNGALDDNEVTLIYEDGNGNIWVGTNNGGINRLDEKYNRFTSFHHLPPGLHCIKSAIAYDFYNYYIGTFMDGLFLFDTKTNRAKKITEKDGLLYNGAWQLNKDNDNNVWAGSRRGFSIIDAKAKQIRNISRLNGLPETSISENSNLINSNGKFMIGCEDGILIFDPADFKPDTIAPLLHIEKLSFSSPRDDKNKDSVVLLYGKKKIRLSYDENKISFFYTALSYQDAAFNQYSVWLEGFEKNRVDAGTNRVATYNNLAPGTYTFHVKAANSDGVWTTSDETITIIISPPWWRTWLAYAIYVLLAGYIIYRINRREKKRYQLKNERILKQKEAEQIVAMDAVKTRFFSNITHEFRTPLTMILSPADEQLKKEDTPAPYKKAFSTIHRNANQLLGLINQLLDLSKVEAGKMKVDTKRGDIGLYLTELTENFLPYALQKNIQLQINNEVKPTEYLFDAGKWERIISNLLSNAIKFTADGGRIDVDMLENNTNGKHFITLAVKDSGTGIAPEKLPHIFDRFYQADESATRQYEGTGIGLALVKEFVELMHGNIDVQSKPGKGTTFKLNIPVEIATNEEVESLIIPQKTNLQPSDAIGSSTEENIASPAEAPLILIAEDNPELNSFIVGSLQKNYRVITSLNGTDAWQICQNEIPDIVLSDVMMPGMDGNELCAAIKSNPLTAHIAVVMLTAKAAPASKIEGLSSGADDYITKPFQVDELLLRIHNLLERQEKLQQYFRSRLAQPDDKPGEPVVQDEFVQSVYSIIDEFIDDSQLGVEFLATKLALSRRTLNRKLSAVLGLPPSEIIKQYRLKKGAEMLRSGNHIADTAYSTGFESPSYFGQCFKEIYGLTPSEYIEKNRRS